MINPDVAPPLPKGVIAETAFLGDGTPVQVVTLPDASRLTGLKVATLETWIADGKIAVCLTPEHQRRVLVPSLWLALPIELRR